MEEGTYLKGFKIGTPTQYRIRVLGGLESSWSDYLSGMSIKTNHAGEHVKVTTLSGRLLDQAALSGVLNTLYEMHYPLLSVENLDENRHRQ
jgi:hypothetical protein